MPPDNNLNTLYEFIDRAQKNRKYLPNVATNFKTPLRLIEKELSEEEKNSINLLKKNLNDIFALIYSRASNSLSAASLEVYKKRILQLIEDYDAYGKDSGKMASWNRSITTRTRRHKEKEVAVNDGVNNHNPLVSTNPIDNSEFQAVDIVLTNGKARIIVPKILTDQDVKKLKAQINILGDIFE